jgi:hypothetical protein
MMLLTFSLRALRFVRLSMSCCVSGPVGFCSASRTTAFNPGSGMDTSCAWLGAMKPASISIGMM